MKNGKDVTLSNELVANCDRFQSLKHSQSAPYAFTQQLQLDLSRHNAQYPTIEVEHFNRAHDRFLLIDNEVYHLGASIKDLGKKWFAFTLMNDLTASEIIGKL